MTITATVQSGVAGTASMNVTPIPSKLVVISGGGQTGPAFSTLANPLVAGVADLRHLLIGDGLFASHETSTENA